jgi:mono/diheme cytochrome c family protein
MSADSSHHEPTPAPGENNPVEQDHLYRENPESTPDINVTDLHEAVMREKVEPAEGMEPLSLWLILFFAVLLFGAGAYLFRYSGGFDSNVYDEDQVAYGPQKGGTATKTVDPVAMGKRLYTVNCASCHQATGQGATGQYPPIAGSDIVLTKAGYGENHLVRIMLDGLAGPLSIAGCSYNGNMPAWAANLKDDQISYILTYIRQEWGNQAGPITPEEVAAVHAEVAQRANPWSDDELKKIPPAALAPATPPAPAAPAAGAAPAKK